MPALIEKAYETRSGSPKQIPRCCRIKDIANHSINTIGGFIHHCDCPRVEVSGVEYYTTYRLCGTFDPDDFGTDAEGYRNRYRTKISYSKQNIGGDPNEYQVKKFTTTYFRNSETGACESETTSEFIGGSATDPDDLPSNPDEYSNLDNWADALSGGVEIERSGLGQFVEAYYEPKPDPGFNGNGNGEHEKSRFEYYALCTRLVPGVSYRLALALDSSDQPQWTYVNDGAVYHDFTALDIFHIVGGILNEDITSEQFTAENYSLNPTDYGLPSGTDVIVIDGTAKRDYPAQGTASRIRATTEANSPGRMQCYINTIPPE